MVNPCSVDMPFVAMNATSTCTSARARSAQLSTWARVRPRTRPPTMSTVDPGRLVNCSAIGSELVTNVSLASGGSASTSRAVVVPASISTVPSRGRCATAAVPMRIFSAVRTSARSATAGSKPRRSTGSAPPCVRRTTPRRSSRVRSRRTVSGVMPKISASAATSTRPFCRARRMISSCRSGAYMRVLSRRAVSPARAPAPRAMMTDWTLVRKYPLCFVLTRLYWFKPTWNRRRRTGHP